MKINKRTIIFIFAVFFLGELFLKGSNILVLTTLELTLIAFIILSEKERSYFLLFSYILISVLTEAAAWQCIGVTVLATLIAYGLVKFIIKFVSVIGEQHLLKLIFILIFSYLIKSVFNYWLVGNPFLANVWGLTLNLIVLFLCYLIFNRLFTKRNVFER